MVVNRFRVEDDEPEKQMENYKTVLPRIISSVRAREVAENYIKNVDFKEKMALTRMLNEWSQDTFSVEDSNGVIRAEAVPCIKDWLNKAGEDDVLCAKKLLTHISNLKKQEDAVQTRNTPGTRQSSRSRQGSLTGSRQGFRPATMASRSGRANGAAVAPKKASGTERPVLQRSFTYGSYYPSRFEGFGNNTSHFNIVRSEIRPKTTLTKAQLYREKYGDKRPSAADTFDPINRSSIFGNVVYPVPQYTVALDGSASQRSRPATQQNRPVAQQKRPSTMQNRPSTQANEQKEQESPSGMLRDNQLRKQSSDEKIKFSANFQNSGEGNVSPIDIPSAPQTAQAYPGSESHRDLGLRKHWPGRAYHPTYNLIG